MLVLRLVTAWSRRCRLEETRVLVLRMVTACSRGCRLEKTRLLVLRIVTASSTRRRVNKKARLDNAGERPVMRWLSL